MYPTSTWSYALNTKIHERKRGSPSPQAGESPDIVSVIHVNYILDNVY